MSIFLRDYASALLANLPPCPEDILDDDNEPFDIELTVLAPLDGRSTTIEVSAQGTVGDVRKALTEAWSTFMQVNQLLLFFGSQHLDDETKYLNSYRELKSGCVLQVLAVKEARSGCTIS